MGHQRRKCIHIAIEYRLSNRLLTAPAAVSPPSLSARQILLATTLPSRHAAKDEEEEEEDDERDDFDDAELDEFMD